MKTLTFLLSIMSFMHLKAADKKHIYLFPGQGSDERLFAEFTFDSAYEVHHIVYPVPLKNETMQQYALRIASQVDTTKPFILIGTSLGGMICTELADIMKPEKVIIISSAKCRQELPSRYKFQKYIPLNKITPKGLIKSGALFMQPIVEPDRNKNKPVFKSMLKAKNPRYMKRTVNMIINWERTSYSDSIIHIHGSNDHTLPLRHVCANVEVNGGSHMMTLTRGEEINLLIRQMLAE